MVVAKLVIVAPFVREEAVDCAFQLTVVADVTPPGAPKSCVSSCFWGQW